MPGHPGDCLPGAEQAQRWLHAGRQGSMEGAARPARLAVARVSLVRGQGPQAGLPLMDDYLRMTEQVADYLTQWSGLQAGDLDTPHPSR